MPDTKKDLLEKVDLGTQISKPIMKRLKDYCRDETRTVTYTVEKALDVFLPDPKQDF